MANPQETRFLRLALAKKALSREQLKTCLQFQQQKSNQGSKIPIWDCTVLNNMLDQSEAEKLQEEAGDLPVEALGGFRIVRKLGEGGMGSVWMAIGEDGQKAAVKVLPGQFAKQRQFLTRFFREAQASIKLQHDNIVRGLDVGEDAGNYFFAMEFVDGTSVRSMIEESGPMDVDKATDIVRQVAEALAYAHENGIVHRDIKPDNIMLTRKGRAKLADLGLARQTDAEMTALTRTGTGMGTPFYMAPEQSVDAKRADARSDIYSLGATWYHMVTGEVPFGGETTLEIMQKHMKQPLKSPQSVRSGIPRAVSTTIERMMAKKPDMRVQSARELCQTIDEKCLGDRDLARELGLERKKADESLWDMKVAIGERVERRRFSTSDVRARIRKGQITRQTPTRRAGTRGEYMPAGSFRELEREFPRDYAARVEVGKKEETPSTRAQLHTLVTDFDKEKRKHARKKKLKKLVPLLVKLAVLAAIVAAAIYFWPQIKPLIPGLAEEATETAAEAP
jgi:serine/threonine protein kinase